MQRLKLKGKGKQIIDTSRFTFHYAKIKTTLKTERLFANNFNLHSTMQRLKRIDSTFKAKAIAHLHSTMQRLKR